MKEVRCSSLAHIMACPGYAYFKDLPKQETNPAAEEGTAAGELLERMLNFQGEMKGEVARNGVRFDDDMRFYIKPLFENILERAQGDVLCETRIDWVTRSGIAIRGQYDASYVDRNGRLCVDDLKYGYGIVDVKENWQLIGYAIGEVIRRNQYFTSIVLRVLQPRPHHEEGPIRVWEISYEELLAFKERIEARMDEIAARTGHLATSGKCKYCAAGGMCPALSRAFNRSLDVSMTFTQDVIDDKTLSSELDLAVRAMELIKVRHESLKQLAVDRIRRGAIIPGYMTERSMGDRKWKSDVSPEVIEILTGRKVTERTILSPAKAEKLGIPRSVIDGLADRQFLGMKLVKKDANEIGQKVFGGKV